MLYNKGRVEDVRIQWEGGRKRVERRKGKKTKRQRVDKLINRQVGERRADHRLKRTILSFGPVSPPHPSKAYRPSFHLPQCTPLISSMLAMGPPKFLTVPD